MTKIYCTYCNTPTHADTSCPYQLKEETMIIRFADAPDVDTGLIDTVELTPTQKKILNDNLLELL